MADHATMPCPKDKAGDSGSPLLCCCPSWKEATSSPAVSRRGPPGQGQQRGCSRPCGQRSEGHQLPDTMAVLDNVLPAAGLRERRTRLSSTRLACTETRLPWGQNCQHSPSLRIAHNHGNSYGRKEGVKDGFGHCSNRVICH